MESRANLARLATLVCALRRCCFVAHPTSVVVGAGLVVVVVVNSVVVGAGVVAKSVVVGANVVVRSVVVGATVVGTSVVVGLGWCPWGRRGCP